MNIGLFVRAFFGFNVDSARYRQIFPVGARKDKEHPEKLYTDPPPDMAANRKYIMRTGTLKFLKGVHSPLFDGDEPMRNHTIKYLMGRGRSAKLLHFRTGVGIHADEAEFVCNWAPKVGPEACPFTSKQDMKCVDNMENGTMMYETSEVHEILKGVPLTDPAMHMYKEASCYAGRYENLAKAHCVGGNLENCHTKLLYEHYSRNGTADNLQFNCTESSST